MKKKWLKTMAALLSTALLLTAQGMPVRADYASGEGQTILEEGGMEAVDGQAVAPEGAAEMARTVSGGNAEIIYPAPSVEWLDKWQLQVDLPEVADEDYTAGRFTAGGFAVEVTKDGRRLASDMSWIELNTGKAIFEISRMLMENGLYSFTAFFYRNGEGPISKTTIVEREYVAPSEKLGTTTAIWHDGSIPRISFAAVPHANYYKVVFYRDGKRSGSGSFIWSLESHEDGTLWLDEKNMKFFLSSFGEGEERVGQAGEYTVTVQAFSEDITLYANGDVGSVSEPFAFDGVFGKMSTSNIAEVKEGLANEKVTEIEYILPDGEQVSEADQAEIFSALKGTDKSLTLSFQSEDQSMGYQWTFDGTEIVDAAKTMNFQIIVDANVQEVIDCVDLSRLNEVDLAFLHEGELPGQATVTVNLQGKLGDAKTANLYYYNPETRQLEVVAENLAIEGDYVAFPMSHCSNYILTAEMLKNLIPDREPEEPAPKPDSQPDTGGNTTGSNAAGSNNTAGIQTQIGIEPASVISYVVEPGDTLKKIAAKFYGSREFWKKIYADNTGSIRNPNRIYAGQVLYIYLVSDTVKPAEDMTGDIYTVQPGDSLWKIAQKIYGKGTLYSKIYEANNDVISNPKKLQVGQKIVVPQ